MAFKIGLLVFDDAEELDFVGPWEVFTMANETARHIATPGPEHDVMLVAEKLGTVRCAKGMRVVPDVDLENCPQLDLLLVPGGIGTRREVKNERLLAWIAKQAEGCRWITSVCTGSLLTTAAGPAKGRRVTTHWAFVETLRGRNEAAEVLERVRFVRDDKVVSAAGVSAGIDMALWLVGQIHNPAFARAVQRAMEYEPAPPYTCDV